MKLSIEISKYITSLYISPRFHEITHISCTSRIFSSLSTRYKSSAHNTTLMKPIRPHHLSCPPYTHTTHTQQQPLIPSYSSPRLPLLLLLPAFFPRSRRTVTWPRSIVSKSGCAARLARKLRARARDLLNLVDTAGIHLTRERVRGIRMSSVAP